MKIAMIYPPFYHKKFNENIPTVDDEFGLFPHLGFGWVAAAIKQCGHKTRLFDAAASKCSYESVLAEVRDYDPDMLFFAAHAIQTFRDMLLWAKYFKRDMGLPQIVGGHEAKVYPTEVMEHDCFDYLCSGEAITFMDPFLTAFQRGSDYDKVPDLYFRSNTGLVKTLPGHYVPFSEHPIPDRSIFPNEAYYSMVSQRKNFTIGMSEVGCPYPCSFCSLRRTGFEARTPVQVADELEHCINEHDIHEIDWFDPIMLFDRERAIGIAQEMKSRKLDMIWGTRCRLDSLTYRKQDGAIDETMIRELAESGCRRLFFGIESGDPEILKAVHKSINFKNTKKILDCCVEHGIRPLGFFIIGQPGETAESAERTIKLACSLPLEYAQFTLCMIKPHSELEQQYVIPALGYDYWREYVRGTVEEQLLPTPWTDLSRAEIERIARRAYLKFYLRPKYVLRMLRRIESPAEFFRYVRVALQLMTRPLRPKRIKKVSLPRRLIRFVAAFADGIMAAVNNGARHPVMSFGGGLRGSWKFAKYEMSRASTDKDMGAPGGADDAEVMVENASERINWLKKDGSAVIADRYIPVSSGALMNHKRIVTNNENAEDKSALPATPLEVSVGAGGGDQISVNMCGSETQETGTALVQLVNAAGNGNGAAEGNGNGKAAVSGNGNGAASKNADIMSRKTDSDLAVEKSE